MTERRNGQLFIRWAKTETRDITPVAANPARNARRDVGIQPPALGQIYGNASMRDSVARTQVLSTFLYRMTVLKIRSVIFQIAARPCPLRSHSRRSRCQSLKSPDERWCW